MSTSRLIPTFDESLISAFHAHRVERGYSQDQVGRLMRAHGLDWTRSVVASFESGVRQISLPEAAVLLAVVGTTLGDFLREAGPIRLSDRVVIDGRAFLDLIDGDLSPMTSADEQAREATVEEEATGDAEIKAAKTLGVDPTLIVEASRRLWGRTLSSQRDRRMLDEAADLIEQGRGKSLDLGEAETRAQTLRARRGHVTRALMTELGPKVEAMQRRRKPKTTETKRRKTR